MNEIEISRTPELSGAEIRTLTRQARTITLLYGIEIGRRLTEAKEIVEHGQWLNFLSEQTEFSQPTASRFMKLYDEYGADQSSLFGAESNYSTLNNLSISNALKLLAIPEEEREQFAADNDLEHKSAREVEELIKQKQELEKQLQTMDKAMQDAEEDNAIAMAKVKLERDEAQSEFKTVSAQLNTARDKIRELEDRPIEVAVQRDEEAIEKAVALAKAEAQTEIDDLKAQSKAWAAEVESLNDQLKEANSTDKEALENRVKELESQLALSTPAVSAFQAAFDRVQQEFNMMLSAMGKAPEEMQDKLKVAAKAIVDSFATKLG